MPPKVDQPDRAPRRKKAAKPPRRIPKKAWLAEVKRDKQACLRLAAAFRTKLPWVLRCKVYHILLEEARRNQVDLGATKPGKNAYVPPLLRIYSPAYVGDKVAWEAAIIFNRQTHLVCRDVDQLVPALMDNKLHESVFPYQWVKMVHITFDIEALTVPILYEADYGYDDDADTEREELLMQEQKNFKDLFKKLESGFSLLMKRHPDAPLSSLTVHLMLKLGDYPYVDSPDVQSRMEILNCERGFLNLLLFIEIPVYDLIHAGARVIITWDEGKEAICNGQDGPLQKPIPGLFHLSKKAWKKEKARYTRWGDEYVLCPYGQKYIQKLWDGGGYSKIFAKNLPSSRETWGYTSFRKLVNIGRRRELADDENEDGFSSGPSTYAGSEWDDDVEEIEDYEDDEDDEPVPSPYYDRHYSSDDSGPQRDYEATYDDMEQWGF